MYEDISFCANQDCPNMECMRHYDKAPKDKLCSWFGAIPREDGICDCFIKDVRGGK